MLATAPPPPPRARVLSTIGAGTEPWREIDPALLGTSTAPCEGSLTVIHVDQVGQVGAQRLAEAWVMASPAPDDTPADVMFRGLRILVRGRRAALFGGSELTDSACAALQGFHDLSTRLHHVESSLSARRAAVRADVPLTHRVGGHDLARLGRVSEMTRWAHTIALDYTDLMRDLRRPGDRQDIDLLARRMLGELILQADLQGRAENLEDSIEFAQELYDTANDRLLEYRYFRTEMIIELLILAVLVGELIMLVIDR